MKLVRWFLILVSIWTVAAAFASVNEEFIRRVEEVRGLAPKELSQRIGNILTRLKDARAEVQREAEIEIIPLLQETYLKSLAVSQRKQASKEEAEQAKDCAWNARLLHSLVDTSAAEEYVRRCLSSNAPVDGLVGDIARMAENGDAYPSDESAFIQPRIWRFGSNSVMLDAFAKARPEVLAKWAADPQTKGRCALLQSLALVKYPPTVQIAAGFAAHDNPAFRQMAAFAFGNLGGAVSEQGLFKLAFDRSPLVRCTVPEYLAQLDTDSATEFCVRIAFESREAEMISAASKALRYRNTLETLLLPFFGDSDPVKVARACSIMTGKPLVGLSRPIIACTRHDNQSVRLAAIEALKRSYDEDYTPTLLGLFRHEDPETRLGALCALRTGPEFAHWDKVAELLGDKDERVVCSALLSLGGSRYEPAIAAITKLTESKVERIRIAAKTALRQIVDGGGDGRRVFFSFCVRF